MLSKKIRGQFPGQTKEKKEEGLKWGEWVGVSLGFPFGGLGEPKLYQNMWCFTRMWEVSWLEQSFTFKEVSKISSIEQKSQI